MKTATYINIEQKKLLKPEEQSPSTWFIHIASKFDVNGIKDDKLKFNYIVANLDSDTANKIREVFNKANRYGQIKTTLIKIF